MRRYQIFLGILFIAVFILLEACTPEVEIPTAENTPTLAPPLETTLPQVSTEPPSVAPTTGPLPTLNLQVALNYPKDLQGQIFFLSTMEGGLQGLGAMDLATGEVSTIFVAPPKAWLLSISMLPRADETLVSYTPPPEEGKPSYGYTDLYTLKPDQSLEPVLLRSEDIEAFFGAFFNPAGDAVYYSHFLADSTSPSGFRYHINRLVYPGGTSQVVVENAFWQRLSPDGSLLAYVTFDNREFDELYVADADGGNPVRALDPAEFSTVDAPFFSPDNQYLYFSAISEEATPLVWWEKLLGVEVALAHAVPSDFWRVSLIDGTLQQITALKDQGMYGTFSPDGQKIAFVSATGLYVMEPDGTNLLQVIANSSFYGNLEWLP